MAGETACRERVCTEQRAEGKEQSELDSTTFGCGGSWQPVQLLFLPPLPRSLSLSLFIFILSARRSPPSSLGSGRFRFYFQKMALHLLSWSPLRASGSALGPLSACRWSSTTTPSHSCKSIDA